MPRVAGDCRRPLEKLKFTHQNGFKPAAFLHLLSRQPLPTVFGEKNFVGR